MSEDSSENSPKSNATMYYVLIGILIIIIIIIIFIHLSHTKTSANKINDLTSSYEAENTSITNILKNAESSYETDILNIKEKIKQTSIAYDSEKKIAESSYDNVILNIKDTLQKTELSYTDKVNKLNEDLQTKNEEIKKTTEELRITTISKDNETAKVTEHENNLKILLSNKQDLEKELNNITKKSSSYEADTYSLKKELTSQTKNYMSLEATSNNLEKVITNNNQTITKLQKELKETVNQKENLETKLKNNINESNDMKDKINRLNANKTELENKITISNENYNVLKLELEKQKSTNDEVKSEIEKKIATLDQNTAEKLGLQQKITALEINKGEIENQINILNTNYAAYKVDSENKIKEFQTNKLELENTINALNAEQLELQNTKRLLVANKLQLENNLKFKQNYVFNIEKISRVRIEINRGSSDRLQLSQLVIIDVNNNIIKPISINASDPYNSSTTKNVPNDGIRAPRPIPNIYHSASNISSPFYEFIIPPTIIKTIEIYNRSDCCSERIQKFSLYVFNTKNILLKNIQLINSPKQIINLNMITRVRIQINNGVSSYLQLSQLVILDFNNVPIQPLLINASDPWDQTNQNIANDGVREPRPYPQIYHSAPGTETTGFYEFIIPPSIIKTIEIYNRTDCCSERMKDFTLQLMNIKDEIIHNIPLEPIPINTFSFSIQSTNA